MNTIKVQLDDKEVEVGKLPIGEYANLIKAIKKLPQHLVKIENLSKAKIIALLPDLAADALPDLIGIVAAGVKLPPEEVAQLGLHEIIKLVEAFLTANKFDEISESVKKIFAHPTVRQYTQKALENQAEN